ncbi:uncharacterized protein LOC122423122 [Cervus canadensis]|uniref:uncharacterized protein LOC122423122 n=1 Tax=Cervus canadensis TaxID=1574408 RepID=UPI001CA348D7|nr:uncharacterized protein LOC122423122 [Cervus canadensis]
MVLGNIKTGDASAHLEEAGTELHVRLGQEIRRHTTETSRAGAQRSPRSRLFRPSGPMRKPEHLLVGPAARPGRIPERTAPLSPQAEKAVPPRHLRLPCPPLRAWAFGLVEFSWKYYTRKPPLPLEHWRQSWALRLTSPRYRGPHACDAETLFLDRSTRAAPQLGEAGFRRLAHGSGCEPRVAVGVAAVHRGQRPARNTCTDGRLNSSVD